MSKLRLGTDLALPLEATTQAIGIVAKRRAGKSYLMRRLAEQLFKAGQQIVIVDPKGDQWGIRSSADGKSPGLPVVILGGEHGDVPLAKDKGDVVAKLVVEERVSVLLDLSFFRKSEVAVFMAEFLETLYRLKAKEVNRTPMMLIIDEADAIAPQKPNAGEERMLGAADDIVRRGGQRGIGCALITQRTAVLNKNVLTQCQVLIALRTIAPQDLKAMNAWVEVHGTAEERDTLMASLPSLPTGDAWVWSPGWPTEAGIFKRIHVLPIETFDSGATPKAGEKRVEPRNLADVDIGALTKQMADTIEKAKADDPKALRAEISSLKKQLAVKTAPAPVAKGVHPSEIDRAVARAEGRLLREANGRIEKLRNDVERVARKLAKEAGPLQALGTSLLVAAEELRAVAPQPIAATPAELEKIKADYAVVATAAKRAVPPARTTAAEAIEGVTVPQQRILNALAGFESMGIKSVDRSVVAVFADQSPTSSGYANNLGRLRTMALTDYPVPGFISLTDAGRAGAEGLVINSIDELHRAWQKQLPAPQWNIVAALIAAHPETIHRDALAEQAGQSVTSSGYANNLGRLRTLGIIGYKPGQFVHATNLLFPEGLS